MAKKKTTEKALNIDNILFNCRDYLRAARNSGSFFEKRDMMLTLVFLRFIGEKYEDGIENLKQTLKEQGLDPEDENIRAAFFDDATFADVAFRDVKRDLTEAICELSKKQVAGVVLEVGPYIKEVTDDIIELANELNLPLLSLPYEIHVSEIISQIYYDKYSKEETNKSVEKFMTELLYEDEKKALERIELFKYNAEKKHIAVYVSVEAEDNSSQTKSVEKVNENGESKNENSSINSKNDDISEQLLRAVRMSFVRQNQPIAKKNVKIKKADLRNIAVPKVSGMIMYKK